jgi:hypothetical protein
MKLILIAFLSVVLSGCWDSTIQTEVSKSASTANQTKIDRDIRNNIVEGFRGCAEAQDIIERSYNKYIAIGVDSKNTKYNCSGKGGINGSDNTNPIPSIVGETYDNIISRVDWFITGASSIFIIIILAQKKLALASASPLRTKNMAITIIEGIFSYFLALCITFILFSIWAIGVGWATQMVRLDNDNNQYKEITAIIPSFSYKNTRLQNILDYQICVKSKSFTDEDQDPSMKIFKTSGGRAISATYGRCRLDGAYALDSKGVEIAKAYNMFDYAQIQDEALDKALRSFIASSERIAATYSKGLHEAIYRPTFKEDSASCDIPSLESVDTHYFDEVNLEKYKAFALNCLSREFVYQLVKPNNMSMDAIDNQQARLQHRNTYICTGGYTQKGMLTQEESLKVYESCIEQNCQALSSPYACGTALNSYFVMKDDQFRQFLTLPASDKRRKVIDNTSALRLVDTFNAQFTLMEEREFYQQGGSVISTIPVATTKGNLTIQEIDKSFAMGHQMKVDGMGGFNLDSVIGRFTGNDGFAGSKRFVVCMQHPNVMNSGFDCGNVYSEMYRFGLKMTIVGSQLKMASAINNSPNKVKMKGADLEYTAMKKIVGNFMSAGMAKKMLVWGMPMVTDGLGAAAAAYANDDGFADEFFDKTNTYSEFYTMMLFSQLNDAAASIVSNAANAMTAMGQFFMYLLPLSDYFIFYGILAATLTEMVFNGVTYKLRWLVNLDATQERRDLDRAVIFLYMEKLLFVSMTTALGFLMIPHIFSATMMIVIGDLNEFSTSLFGWQSGIRAAIIASLMSILIFVVIYKVTSSLMDVVSGHAEHFMHGKVSTQDKRIQGTAETKAVIKAYKGNVAA